MKKGLTAFLFVIGVLGLLVVAAPGVKAAAISLPDGTVTADTYYSGVGLNAYWAESVTTLTIDAENVGDGLHVEVSGKITGISNISTSWVEIGLIQKGVWDYWQTVSGYEPAVFDKGIYVVHWTEDGDIGLQLKEGWWVGTSTQHAEGGFAWDLEAPTTENPWEFTFSMYPTSSGNAYLSVGDEVIYGTEPLVYDGTHNGYSFSSCYLIAQIWSLTEDATFSFEDVQATVVPIPPAAILLASGLLGLVGIRRFRNRR